MGQLGELRSRRSEIVVVLVSPFGTDGPSAGRPATEVTLQALSGSIVGRGEPTSSPLPAGGDLVEWASGTAAAVGTIGTLRHVETTGEGDLLDVAKLEGATRSSTRSTRWQGS